jgi:heme oxygenase (biliverdin-IX-beta and delta-forming)
MSDTAREATTGSKENHGGSGGGPAIAEPTHEAGPARRRTPGEEARTLVAGAKSGSLASLSEDGMPWASIVTFGSTNAGEPVLVVSTMAEHGRNLAREPRCSIAVAEPVPDGDDPLDRARITLAGHVIVPEGKEADAALEAHARRYPFARGYATYADFTTYVLRVERVRWVGGFARMSTVAAADYAAADVDPSAPGAASARQHLNDDHADSVLLWAKTLGGYADALEATCEAIDRYGVDIRVQTPRGQAPVRVGFAKPAQSPGDLRAATIELAKAARIWTPKA